VIAWPIRRLGDIANEGKGEIRTGPFGAQLHRSDYTNSADGIPVVMPVNMVGGRVKSDGIAKISVSKAAEMSAHITRLGDVLLSRRGDVGRYCLIDAANAGALCGTGSLRVSIQGSELLPEYLCMFLETPAGLHELQGKAVGSTMPNINSSIVKSLELPVPPLPIQHKITSVLSAYDDLIENNTRRIQILQEMAQRIYREWFVDFRYPGHEAAPLVDSELGPIPEGWEVRNLFDIADVTFGFPFKSELFNAEVGLPVIRIRDIPTGQSATLTTEEPAATFRVDDGDILVGMDGEFHMGRWSAGAAWLNQRVARLRCASDAICRYALFLALEKPIADWNQAIVGTTVAHLGKRHLELINIPIPPAYLSAKLSAVLDPVFDQEITLRKTIRQIQETRDLLLPRLMSGEIDVTDLDIAMPEAAA
jgi:type I restriction enzyme S subunit